LAILDFGLKPEIATNRERAGLFDLIMVCLIYPSQKIRQKYIPISAASASSSDQRERARDHFERTHTAE
jgi:hypothetical protein